MKIFNKRLVSLLAGLAIVIQANFASAGLIADYELEFSSVAPVGVGQSFEVDVYLDIATDSELTTFGFNFENAFTNISFDGFTTPDWIFADNFNDVGGVADIFGPNGDSIQIATLHFTALSEGTENVAVYGEFFENGGGAQFYNFVEDRPYDGSVGGSFTVSVPEPSSFALMLIAGLGLTRMRSARNK